jgi:hypothetical protein
MATMAMMEHLLARALRTGNNYRFLSPPAYGKTTSIYLFADKEQAKDKDFLFIPFDGGTLAPTDTVMSMPNIPEQTIDRLLDRTLIPATREGAHGIIYIGEWMLMAMEVSKGFQKMVNHEYFAQGRRIQPGVIFITDGNRLKDRSGGQQGSRAVDSRFRTFELEFDTERGLDIVKSYYHTKVSTFLIRNPTLVDNYADIFENEKREANDLAYIEGKSYAAWANLRSWKYVSDILFDQDNTSEIVYPEEIHRGVGTGVATTFETFCNMLDKLATVEDIVKKPDKAPVPGRMDECWALLTMLAMVVNKDTFKPISKYMNRYTGEHQTAFFRLMNDRLAKAADGNSTAIRATDEYKDWITSPHISKLLQGASQR